MEIAAQYETVPWLKTADNSSNISTVNKGILDKDDFLKLLITELKYQDPMEPMKDKEFMAQMASFTSLEQMKNLNTGFEKLSTLITDSLIPSIQLNQAGSMIGKEVSYLSISDEGEINLVSGTVNSVVIKDGQSYCVIDGVNVGLSSIMQINADKTADDTVLNQILDQMKRLVAAMIPTEAESDG